MRRYDFSNLQVLIVDDCRFMRQLLERLLDLLGIGKIHHAKDGHEAIKRLGEITPDIIICDWEMEPMNGPSLIRFLRQDKSSPAPYIPVIMLSGYTEASKVEKARDFGITEFLAKPVSAKTLYKRLVSIVERPRVFVRTEEFFGPCRRRLKLPPPEDERRHFAKESETVRSPATD